MKWAKRHESEQTTPMQNEVHQIYLNIRIINYTCMQSQSSLSSCLSSSVYLIDSTTIRMFIQILFFFVSMQLGKNVLHKLYVRAISRHAHNNNTIPPSCKNYRKLNAPAFETIPNISLFCLADVKYRHL